MQAFLNVRLTLEAFAYSQGQYKFLHEVVYEALCSTSEPIPKDEFPTEYCRLRKKHETENQTNMLLEYGVNHVVNWAFLANVLNKYQQQNNIEK